jgi:hypothetical protein
LISAYADPAYMFWAWAVVIGLGVFHGLNPAEGWLFAVSNAMQMRSSAGVFSALLPLALGHLLAIAAVLLPASLLLLYVWHFAALKLVAGLALVTIGIYRLLNLGRHSRFLARIGPRHLVLWSFLMATSHGAGLMLAPVVLDLCQSGAGMGRMVHLPGGVSGSLEIASLATLLHSMAMIATAGLTAWLVYRWLGLTILRKSWFNMDLLWGWLLIFVGVVALAV